MKKRNEYTGKFINVTKVDTIFRTSDSIAYGVYKDSDDKYYVDAYDGAYSIAKFLDSASSDSEAVKEAQKYIDEIA